MDKTSQIDPRCDIVICSIEAFLASNGTISSSYEIVDFESDWNREKDRLRALLLFKAIASSKSPESFGVRGHDMVIRSPSRFREVLEAIEQIEVTREDIKNAAEMDFEGIADMIYSKVLVSGGKRLD